MTGPATLAASADVKQTAGAAFEIGSGGPTKVAAGSDLLLTAAATAAFQGADVVINAGGSITLSAGGSTIKISGAGIETEGSAVKVAGGSVDVFGQPGEVELRRAIDPITHAMPQLGDDAEAFWHANPHRVLPLLAQEDQREDVVQALRLYEGRPENRRPFVVFGAPFEATSAYFSALASRSPATTSACAWARPRRGSSCPPSPRATTARSRAGRSSVPPSR